MVTRGFSADVCLGMSTLRDHPTVGRSDRRERPVAVWGFVLLGSLSGLGLGVVARWWMRLLTEDPDFSWSGTIFIVLAFMVAGSGHGMSWFARRVGARRRWSTAARVTAVALTLPIFTAAGAMMLPTVLGASVASSRSDWPRGARVAAAALAVPVPIVIVIDLAADSVTWRRLFGVLLLAATYTAIVRSLQATVAPLDDGWRMPRRMRVVLAVAASALLVLVATSVVGIGS